MLIVGRGKLGGVPKTKRSIRLPEDVWSEIKVLGGEQGYGAGFLKAWAFYKEFVERERLQNMDEGVITWTQNSIRTPVQKGLRDKFLMIVDLWVRMGCGDLKVLNIYAAIGRSKGNGAAAKKALTQLVDSGFVTMESGVKFNPRIVPVEGVSQDEFDIKFDRYKALITQEL